MSILDSIPDYSKLLGNYNSLSNLVKAAQPLQALAMSNSLSGILNSSRLAALASPPWAEVLGSAKWQQSLKAAGLLNVPLVPGLQSLAALSQPLAAAQLAVPGSALANISSLSSVSRLLADAFRTSELVQQAASVQQWQKHLLTDWASLTRQLTTPAWTTQLQSIGKLMGEAQNYLDAAWAEVEDPESEEIPVLDVAGALNALHNRLDGFAIASAADVAALRQEMNTHFATTVADIQANVVELTKAGKSPLAKFALIIGIVGSFLTIVAFPSFIDWCITKMERVPVAEQPATKQELQAFKAELLDSIKQFSASQGKLRMVQRPVRLRLKPNLRSQVVGTVAQGVQVTVLDSVGKYVYVSYQDLDRLPMHGWVPKKYLKRPKSS